MSDKPPHEALRELIDALASDTNLLTEEVYDALTVARASLDDEPGSHAWACLHCWTMGTAGEECAKTDACHMHPLHWSSRASLEPVHWWICVPCRDAGLGSTRLPAEHTFCPVCGNETSEPDEDDQVAHRVTASPYGWILECHFEGDTWYPFVDGYEQTLESAKESLEELVKVHGAENCRITALHRREQDV